MRRNYPQRYVWISISSRRLHQGATIVLRCRTGINGYQRIRGRPQCQPTGVNATGDASPAIFGQPATEYLISCPEVCLFVVKAYHSIEKYTDSKFRDKLGHSDRADINAV